jgi:hypothetical protein
MGKHVSPFGHISEPNSLLIVLNAKYLSEKQQMPIYSLWFHNTGTGTNILMHEHANHYATDVVHMTTS